MKLVELNWTPTDRQLRQFAAIALVALPLLGWLWGASESVIGWLAGSGAVLLLVGLTAPHALRPVYVGLSLLAIPIGLAVGELVLLLIYFGVFLPIGLIFRVAGRDRLSLRVNRQTATCWDEKKRPAGPASYYHPW